MTVDDRQIQDFTLRHPGSTPRVTRRGVEIALGALWLVDGALQFQPSMFTRGFFVDTLGMANMGLPGPVATVSLRQLEVAARSQPLRWPRSLLTGRSFSERESHCDHRLPASHIAIRFWTSAFPATAAGSLVDR
ncbi:MAG: hypothetical protein HOY79_23490 [Streptomyces sp.]|nr:hypothetical protein [Streptomyces sp.]